MSPKSIKKIIKLSQEHILSNFHDYQKEQDKKLNSLIKKWENKFEPSLKDNLDNYSSQFFSEN